MLFNADGERLESVGKLLSTTPSEPVTFTRTASQYDNHSDKFLVKEKNYQRQYAHIYAARLWSVRAKLEKAARNKWGEDVTIRKLFELQTDERCVVIGTLFKHMDLKPSILRELSEEHSLMPQPPRDRYIEESDYLILEDELQRIVLKGSLDVQSSVTGMIVALYGREEDEDRGKFLVEGYCFQELPAQVERPLLQEDKYVALVSGLDLGSANEDQLSSQLLADLLTGQLGDECQQCEVAKIVRVIVAGNSLSRETQDKNQFTKAKYLTKNTAAASVEAMKSLDDILVQLSACIDVDVLPGEFDPANHVLPQQPLHRCMFPQAGRYPTMHCVSNPYHCTVDGVRFLGSSGQPLHDMFRYSNMDDHLDMLEKTLVAGHIAPTAPDTLGCYPYADTDPFLIEDCPHVYFAGNMPEFRHKYFEGASGQRVLLLTVPRFSQSRSCIIINLRTLECQPISFQTTFPSQEMEQESPDVEK